MSMFDNSNWRRNERQDFPPRNNTREDSRERNPPRPKRQFYDDNRNFSNYDDQQSPPKRRKYDNVASPSSSMSIHDSPSNFSRRPLHDDYSFKRGIIRHPPRHPQSPPSYYNDNMYPYYPKRGPPHAPYPPRMQYPPPFYRSSPRGRGMPRGRGIPRGRGMPRGRGGNIPRNIRGRHRHGYRNEGDSPREDFPVYDYQRSPSRREYYSPHKFKEETDVPFDEEKAEIEKHKEESEKEYTSSNKQSYLMTDKSTSLDDESKKRAGWGEGVMPFEKKTEDTTSTFEEKVEFTQVPFQYHIEIQQMSETLNPPSVTEQKIESSTDKMREIKNDYPDELDCNLPLPTKEDLLLAIERIDIEIATQETQIEKSKKLLQNLRFEIQKRKTKSTRKSLIEQIYEENREKAKLYEATFEKFECKETESWKGLEPKDLPFFKHYEEHHKKIADKLEKFIRDKLFMERVKYEKIAIEYAKLKQMWREKNGGLIKEEYVTKSYATRSIMGDNHNRVDYIPDDKYKKTAAVIPPMLIGEDREFRFESRNGFVEDVMGEYKARRALEEAWTEEEKEIFMKKFADYPKDLHMIAKFLPNKTVYDVVNHYYNIKNTKEFKELLKKLKNKGRTHKKIVDEGSRGRRGRNVEISRELRSLGVTADNVDSVTNNYLRPRVRTSSLKEETIQTSPTNGNKNQKEQTEDRFRWSDPEKQHYIELFAIHGRNFAHIAKKIKTKNPAQCKNFYNNYKKRLNLDALLPEDQRKQKPSKRGGKTIKKPRKAAHWTKQEKDQFMEYFKEYGKNWKKLSELIPTKTQQQIKNYYQNYKARLGIEESKRPSTPSSEGQEEQQGMDLFDLASIAEEVAETETTAKQIIKEENVQSTNTSSTMDKSEEASTATLLANFELLANTAQVVQEKTTPPNPTNASQSPPQTQPNIPIPPLLPMTQSSISPPQVVSNTSASVTPLTQPSLGTTNLSAPKQQYTPQLSKYELHDLMTRVLSKKKPESVSQTNIQSTTSVTRKEEKPIITPPFVPNGLNGFSSLYPLPPQQFLMSSFTSNRRITPNIQPSTAKHQKIAPNTDQNQNGNRSSISALLNKEEPTPQTIDVNPSWFMTSNRFPMTQPHTPQIQPKPPEKEEKDLSNEISLPSFSQSIKDKLPPLSAYSTALSQLPPMSVDNSSDQSKEKVFIEQLAEGSVNVPNNL